ncbi:hypothetical protein V8C37DRAFT_375014 [Trichoderma ceciliae]
MVGHVSSNQPASPASPPSSLPPLEELLREPPPASKSRQSTNKDGDRGERDASRNSMVSKSNNGNNGNNGDDDGISPIPRLDCISAAIFVPIPESNTLLSPLGFAPDSPDYHRAALDLTTHHEASVRDNLEALFQREILRISLDAEASNPSFDYFNAAANVRAEQEAALRHDGEAMIANMREPENPSVDHNITKIPFPNMDVPVTYMPINSPRESAAKDIMKVVSAAAHEMSSFDKHVLSLRETIMKQIQDSCLQSERQSDRTEID